MKLEKRASALLTPYKQLQAVETVLVLDMNPMEEFAKEQKLATTLILRLDGKQSIK